MSISFSGLASGLDTSSWVDSLVALKRAKVTTLEEEKSTVELTKDAVESIKSFFSSFRSVLEKVTDTKFGNTSMDLFSQNLANSSNLDILTASADSSAQEATYNILVDKIATNTQVNSSYITVYDRTTIADTSSKLIDLRATDEDNNPLQINIDDAGSTISVTVDGIKRGITLTKSDTIATFAQKLNDIGVESYYNESTGIFSIDIDDDAIEDGDTNLKKVLNLTGVNEGYVSSALQISYMETIYSAANSSTTFGELSGAGFVDDNGNAIAGGQLEIRANDKTYTISVSSSMTISSFIQDLTSSCNVEATLDATGVFTITDAEIVTDGENGAVGQAVLNAFGLEVDVFESTQATDNLKHTTVITSVTTATTDTCIKDLGEGIKIDSSNDKITVVNSDNVTTTITLTTSTKIGDLLEGLQNAGLYAAINSDGQIEIAGGRVSGAILSDLGLEETPYTAMATGNALQETILEHKTAELGTRFVEDLGVTEGYLKITTPEGTDYYEKIYSGQTINMFMQDLANLGIASSLSDDGILTITGGAFETLSDADVNYLIGEGKINETADRYKHGTNLIECLYGQEEISLAQTTVSSTRAKSKALTQKVTTVYDADLKTTLGTLGLSEGTAVFNVRGEDRTINVTADTTLSGLISLLDEQGISASFDEDTHRFSVDNATIVEGSGSSNLADVLGMTTTVAGKYTTSSALFSKTTVQIDATRDTKLSDYGISNSMSAADRTISLFDSDGNSLGTFTAAESSTIGNLVDFINSKSGVSATLSDGVLTIHNGYVENTTLESAMGLEHSNKSSYVLGSILTHTTTSEVTGETTLGNIFDTIGTSNKVSGGYNLYFNSESIAVSSSTTIDDLINAIYEKGGTASMDSTGRLSVNGGTLTGSVAEALGIVSVSNTASVSATGEDMYTTQVVKADLNTKLSDLGLNSSNVVIHNALGTALSTISFTGSDTIGNVFGILKENGIDGTLSEGVISLTSADGKYITGTLADAFGITTQTVTTTVNTSSSSTAEVTHTGTVTATIDTTLGEINAVTAAGQTFQIYREDGTCIATISGLTTSSTIDDLFEAMKPFDIVGTLTNGVIDLYSASGNYAEGTIMTNLGVTKQSGENVTYTVSKTTTSSAAITFTDTVKATESDKISSFITLPDDKVITVYDSKNSELGTINVTSNTTFAELFSALGEHGISASIHDGVISFSSTSGSYAKGDVLTELGIDTNEDTATITSGKTTTGSGISYTTTHTAQGSTTLATVGIATGNITIKNAQTGAGVATFSAATTDTFDQLAAKLGNYGISAEVVDGIFHISSGENYAEGAVLTLLGVSTSKATTTVSTTVTTVGAAATGSAASYSYTTFATEDTTLGAAGLTRFGTVTVYNAYTDEVLGTFNTNSNTTFLQMSNSLGAYGITAGITDGVFFISSDTAYALGATLSELGVGTTSVVTTQTVTGTTSTTTIGKSETGTVGVKMMYSVKNIVSTPQSMTGSNTIRVTVTLGQDNTSIDYYSVPYTTTTPHAVTGTTGVLYKWVTTTLTTTGTVGLATTGVTQFLQTITTSTTTTGTVPQGVTGTKTITVTETIPVAVTGTNGVSVTTTHTTTSPMSLTGTVAFSHTVTTRTATTSTVGQAITGTVGAMKTITITTTATADYTWAELGFANNVTIRDTNSVAFYTIKTTATVGSISIENYSGNAGFEYIRGSDLYIAGVNADTIEALKASCQYSYYADNYTFQVDYAAYGMPEAKTITVQSTATVPVTGDNTIRLSYGLAAGYITISVANSSTGETTTIKVGASSRIAVLAAATGSYDIQTTITNDGKLSFNPTGDWYISYISPNLATGAGMSYGEGYTYNSVTQTVVTTRTEPGPRAGHDTLNEMIGLGNSTNAYITLKNASTAESYTITVAGSWYIENVMDSLDLDPVNGVGSSGLYLALADTGRYSIISSGDWYVYGMSDTLANGFGWSTGAGNSYYTTTVTHTDPVSASTSLNDLHVSYQTITVYKAGEGSATTQIAVPTYATFNDINSWLSAYDITVSFDGSGHMTVDPHGDYFITSMGTDLNNLFGIGQQLATQSRTTQQVPITLSNTIYDATKNSGGSAATTYYFTLTNASTGATATFSATATQTLNVLKNRMNNYTIKTAVTSDGRLTFDPEGNWYISGMTSEFATAFGLTIGSGYSYGVVNRTVVTTSTVPVDMSSTYQDLTGASGAFSISIRDASTGTTDAIITYNMSDTFESLADILSRYNIDFYIDSDGYFHTEPGGNYYISGYNASGGTYPAVYNIFGTAAAYTTVTKQATTSAKQADTSMTLTSAIGLSANTNQTISLLNTNNGSRAAITVKGSETVQSMLDKLANYTISSSVTSDYNLNLTPNGSWCIEYMGATLKTGFGITTGNNNTYTTKVNYRPVDYNDNIELIDWPTYFTVTNSRTGQSVTEEVPVNGSTTTLADIWSILDSYDIDLSITNDGRITISPNSDWYLSSFDMLRDEFGFNCGEGYTYYKTTEPINMSTPLVSIISGATASSTYWITVKNGATGATTSVSVKGSETLATLATRLNTYSIGTSTTSDGRLVFSPTGDWYISEMTNAFKNRFGFTVGDGKSYDLTTVTTTSTHTDSDLSINALTGGSSTNSQYITIVDSSTGSSTRVTISGSDTIADVSDKLSNYSLSASTTVDSDGDGYLTLGASGRYFISSLPTLLTSNFGVQAGEGHTYWTVVHDVPDRELEETITANTTSARQLTKTVTGTVNGNTLLGNISGATGNIVVKNGTTGATSTIAISSDMTVDSLMAALSAYDIQSSLSSSGVLSVAPKGNFYISTAGALSAFGIGASTTSTTTVRDIRTVTENKTNGTTTLKSTKTTFLNLSSTFAQLGLNAGTVTINGTNGAVRTITFASTATADDLLTALSGYGISGSISADGRLTLGFSDEYYLANNTQTNAVLTKFGITSANTRTTTTITVNANTTSNLQTHNVTTTMDTSTTFSKLGVSGNTYVTVDQNGTQFVITVKPEQTVNDLISTLAGYGVSASITGGKLTIAGGTDAYVSDMTSTLKSALKIEAGQNKSWESKYSSTWVNSDSRSLTMTKNTLLIDGLTVLNTINGWNNGNGKLAVHQTNGQYVTINVNGSGTVDDFFRQISQYGLVGTIGEDGKVTVMGSGNVYLQSVSGGSNILSSLKLSNVKTAVETVTSNRTSSSLSHTVTVTATGTTQLGNLENSAGSSITFTGNNANLVLKTFSDAGNVFTTLTFSKTNTLYDVMSRLSEYGINAAVDAMGRFDVTSSTLNDFEISGALGTFLMGSYTKQYGVDTTYNVSTNLMQKTVVNMSDSTKLSDLNVTSGKFEITQEGVKYTVTVSDTQTVGDFRNMLAQYGINSYIDGEGRLTAFGTGESWLDSVTGGSNIVSKFGLDANKWSLGEITQTSSSLGDKEVKLGTASLATKLSELQDSNGNALGIESGNIFVYQDGTRSTLYIDKNDTLETLSAKLSQYGITMSLGSDGKVYFDGDDNSYMTAAASNSSNILDKIKATSWNTRYDSTSQNLSYEVTSNSTMMRSTKLSDLQDSEGNSLGITTGTYYIYEDGVRNTETITENTTVNDLMAAMATYGLIADISENGTISVSGYNNTFMQTSSLLGDNSNVFEALFDATWDFTNVYKSNNIDVPKPELHSITRDTKLADIIVGEGKEGYKAGNITVTKDGIKTTLELTKDDTVGTLIDQLALYGFEGVINDNGQLILRASGDSNLSAGSVSDGYSNALSILGVEQSKWINTNNYDGSSLNVIEHTTSTIAATRDTELSELGVTTGEYNIYKNGVKYTALISSDETLGSFIDTLKSFGIEASLVDGKLQIVSSGDVDIKKSASSSASNVSNVTDLFVNSDKMNKYTGTEQTSSIQTTQTAATEATTIKDLEKEYALYNSGTVDYTGTVTLNINGTESTIQINENDTIGNILSKFRAVGLEATISNGQIMVQSGYDDLEISSDNASIAGNSNSLFKFVDDLGKENGVRGYSASSVGIKANETVTENLSAAKFADDNTKLGLLNISSGTLTVYRNGQKSVINVNEDDTFADLRRNLSSAHVNLEITSDGYLKIYSDGNEVMVGATTDTSNFVSITGMSSSSGVSMSARELYCVNSGSTITTSGLFRRGDVTQGTFTVGNAVFTIDGTTTLSDIIAQINASEDAQATAYWDNIRGQFVIQSNKTGSAFVNIEAGTSNFTDILGYTTDGALNTEAQQVGNNARFAINGTYYTSSDNKIDSSITRIKGVTIDLKKASEGEKITLTIERDKETLANAVSDVVTSYNELMSNLEEELSSSGTLKKESTLKMIRDQLRSIMMGSQAGATIFKNLKQIGITTSAANGSNISTAFSDITSLTFDKDAFIKAYNSDQSAVKLLLCGDNNTTGILTQLENKVEEALSASGYFTTTEKSYDTKISNLNTKIKKTEASVERYKALLEKKFSAMDMLISQLNRQYSSFLTS